MSMSNPPRYVERFEMHYNRGNVRVRQLMEISIDLATIRRCMGVRAAYSKLRKCQAGHTSVICLGLPEIVEDATSDKMGVTIE